MLYFTQMLRQDKNQNVSDNYNDHDSFYRSFSAYCPKSYASRQLTLRDVVDGPPLLLSPLPPRTACKDSVRPAILVHIFPMHAIFRAYEATE